MLLRWPLQKSPQGTLEQSRLCVDNCAVPSPSWGYFIGLACYAGFRCVHGCSWEDYSRMEKVEWDSALRNVRCEDAFELEIGEKKRLSLFYNSA